MTSGANTTRQLLDEINAASKWIRARKHQPIWARRVDQREQVQTLEGIEIVEPGNYLCRGEAGELWPQRPESLMRTFVSTNIVDEDGWTKYEVKPDSPGVLAAPVDHAFTVHGRSGPMTGKSGDYVVKRYEDRDVEYPDDVWIVDRLLFAATYTVLK